VSTWTVTVQKPVNKLKKGDKQVVKARSGFEAINKAMKLWKDPALKAASADSFKITKEGLEEALDENLRKQIAQMASQFPEGSKVKMKDGGIGTVLSVTKDSVKVGVGKKTMNHKPSELSVVKEDAIEEAAKVNPKAMAADIPQMELSKFLKKASRKPKVYFDGDDLVDVDKTVVRGALDPKKKITVQKLIDALTESVDPKVAKAVQGLNDLGNKMKGQDAKQVKRIEALFRKGNKKVMQGALRAMDTDLRDQIQDVLEPQGFWKNGVVDF